MFDVVIVGARCAGASLAFLLAREGFKVLLIDRTVFPSDTISGHYIQPAGVSCLNRWGLAEYAAAGCTPPQHRLTFDFGSLVLTGNPSPAADGNTVGYGPRRWLFDPLLAQAAVAAGAELWEGVSVQALIRDHDGVAGVTGVTRTGKRVEARAQLIVGADGKRSRIAEMAGAPRYNVQPGSTCMAYTYFSGFSAGHTRLFARKGRFFVVLPTSRDLTFVGATWPVAFASELRSAPQIAFERAIAEVPWIADRTTAARQEERLTTMADLEGFFRAAHGPGWALLGDAGYHRDPITAQGMSDAFRQAEWLAQAVRTGFEGSRSLDACLAGFQRLRDSTMLPMYRLTHELARLAAPAPQMAARLASLADDPSEASRFFGVIAGTVNVDEFFGTPQAAA